MSSLIFFTVFVISTVIILAGLIFVFLRHEMLEVEEIIDDTPKDKI